MRTVVLKLARVRASGSEFHPAPRPHCRPADRLPLRPGLESFHHESDRSHPEPRLRPYRSRRDLENPQGRRARAALRHAGRPARLRRPHHDQRRGPGPLGLHPGAAQDPPDRPEPARPGRRAARLSRDGAGRALPGAAALHRVARGRLGRPGAARRPRQAHARIPGKQRAARLRRRLLRLRQAGGRGMPRRGAGRAQHQQEDRQVRALRPQDHRPDLEAREVRLAAIQVPRPLLGPGLLPHLLRGQGAAGGVYERAGGGDAGAGAGGGFCGCTSRCAESICED